MQAAVMQAAVGVGLGASEGTSPTHFGEKIGARQRVEMLNKSLEILAGLWSGEPFSYRLRGRSR
jgi:hypothetical protein